MNIGKIVREVELVPDPMTVPIEPKEPEPDLPEPIPLPTGNGPDDRGRAA